MPKGEKKYDPRIWIENSTEYSQKEKERKKKKKKKKRSSGARVRTWDLLERSLTLAPKAGAT